MKYSCNEKFGDLKKNVVKKFYDSLHYLTLLRKEKPKDFVYVLEYPKGDALQ